MPQTIDAGAFTVTIDEDEAEGVRVDPISGAVEIDQPDGGVVVQFPGSGGVAGEATNEPIDPKVFYENLCDKIEEGKLNLIVEDLIEQIQADDQSRQEWLANRKRGLDLLGLKLQDPKSAVGDSSSAADGMSVVTNPTMLELVLKGWANAQGELLPARGPAKIEDVSGQENSKRDELAEELENGVNWYLTTRDTSYYPETSHMLLWGVYFGGSGFKKVHIDPIRKRPRSDSVDPKDLIVSDTTKDLASCERITHQTLVRPSVMKRYQAKKFWREVALQPPTPQPNVVDYGVASIQGTTLNVNTRPEDQPYTVWETQCELDLPEFAPPEFKDKAIPLPYRVTIEKDSRVVLAIRRDWKPEDVEAERRQIYVKYPYVPGPGFYGTGMLNIVGNGSAALTAAWREALDAGMYANFPGGLVTQIGNRQQSSNLRPAPGEFVPVQVPTGTKIQDAFMPLPYKDVTPGLMSLIDKIQAQMKSVGSAPDVPVGEGVQNVPVGTMLAHIEQATQIMMAAHKGMHTAQSEELDLIVDLFREEPESFWRGNKKMKKGFWNEQKLFQALDTYSLVPRSDPNVPSHVHRMMKAVALVQMSQLPIFEGRFDIGQVQRRALAAMKEDPTGLVIEPGPKPPGPDEIEANAKAKTAEAKLIEAQGSAQRSQTELQKEMIDSVQQIRESASKEKLAEITLQTETIKHAGEQQIAQQKAGFEQGKDQRAWIKTDQDERKLRFDIEQGQQEMQLSQAGFGLDQQKVGLDAQKVDLAGQKHQDDTSLKSQQLQQGERKLDADVSLGERAADQGDRKLAVDARHKDRAADQGDEKLKIAAKPKPAPKGKK